MFKEPVLIRVLLTFVLSIIVEHITFIFFSIRDLKAKF